MEIKKTFKWVELTSDGLLKEPKDEGPYYNKENLNDHWGDGFDTELEAIEQWIIFKKAYPYSSRTLALIPIYTVKEDEDV